MAMLGLTPITDNALPTDSSLSAGIQDLLNLDLVYLLGKKLLSKGRSRTIIFSKQQATY